MLISPRVSPTPVSRDTDQYSIKLMVVVHIREGVIHVYFCAGQSLTGLTCECCIRIWMLGKPHGVGALTAGKEDSVLKTRL